MMAVPTGMRWHLIVVLISISLIIITVEHFLLCLLAICFFWLIHSILNVAAPTAAKSLQSCLTLCDPIDGSPLGSLSLGFSRQEHWSGLPFPSPMCESEKWKWSRSVVSNSVRPHRWQPTRLRHPWDFPGKSTGVGCHCFLWFWMLNSLLISVLVLTSFFIFLEILEYKFMYW